MNVLAAKVADLGDVLLTTPALAGLHQSGAEIDLLLARHCTAIVAGAPFVRRLIATDRDAHLNPLAWRAAARRQRDLAALRALRRERYDALCLFHHLTTWRGVARWTLLSAALGVRVRAGLDNGRGRFLTHRAADRGFGASHEAEYWLGVAAALPGAPPAARPATSPPRLWLPIGPDDRAWARRWHAASLGDRPYVVLHPGAGAYIPAKRWPIEHFAALASRLRGSGFGVVVIGGDDARGAAVACGAGSVPDCRDLAGLTSLGQTAAVIERGAGFVGNDSLPMHLAAAAQRPTVAIFGPTNAAAWGPWPRSDPWLRMALHQTWCQPCIYTGHALGRKGGCGPRPCLTSVRPESVERELHLAIEARGQSRDALVATP